MSDELNPGQVLQNKIDKAVMQNGDTILPSGAATAVLDDPGRNRTDTVLPSVDSLPILSPEPAAATAEVPPSPLTEVSPVPSPIDEKYSLSTIASKLEEFQGMRTGDDSKDRKMRHQRQRFFKGVLTDAPEDVQHALAVKDKSFRTLYLKQLEKGISLPPEGTGADLLGIISKQVGTFKDLLAQSAQTLPTDKQEHYLKKRLTPNVADYRRKISVRLAKQYPEVAAQVAEVNPAFKKLIEKTPTKKSKAPQPVQAPVLSDEEVTTMQRQEAATYTPEEVDRGQPTIDHIRAAQDAARPTNVMIDQTPARDGITHRWEELDKIEQALDQHVRATMPREAGTDLRTRVRNFARGNPQVLRLGVVVGLMGAGGAVMSQVDTTDNNSPSPVVSSPAGVSTGEVLSTDPTGMVNVDVAKLQVDEAPVLDTAASVDTGHLSTDQGSFDAGMSPDQAPVAALDTVVSNDIGPVTDPAMTASVQPEGGDNSPTTSNDPDQLSEAPNTVTSMPESVVGPSPLSNEASSSSEISDLTKASDQPAAESITSTPDSLSETPQVLPDSTPQKVEIKVGETFGSILAHSNDPEVIANYLNNPANLDTIEATVVINLDNLNVMGLSMTQAEVHDLFDKIRNGELPMEAGWKLLNTVAHKDELGSTADVYETPSSSIVEDMGSSTGRAHVYEAYGHDDATPSESGVADSTAPVIQGDGTGGPEPTGDTTKSAGWFKLPRFLRGSK